MKRSVMKEVLKEYKELNLKSFSDGQILVTFPDMNNLLSVHITLFPKDGYYRGGKFDFALDLPISYPHAAAKVRSLTKMFHPNIDYSGSICFNILSSEWENCLRIADYAHALLWLLYQPNLNSRLNGDVPGDEQEFAAMARVSVEGGSVAGQFFPGCLVDESKRLEEEEKAQQLEQRLEQNVEPEELATITPPTGAGVQAMRQFFDQQRAGGRTPSHKPTIPRYLKHQRHLR
ncbi:ubiquitin-conjugating enzyme E2 N [Balamuthia mandrillaris]